jgi:hypothetical protein
MSLSEQGAAAANEAVKRILAELSPGPQAS